MIKSDRLKKLEMELEDLEQWLKLGLVPKKDLEKHKEEIRSIKAKIQEEVERIKLMKESGDVDEYVIPKKSTRQAYAEPQTFPDMDAGIETDAGLDMETESFEAETTTAGGEDTEHEKEETTTTTAEEEDDEDPFSDKSRWKRGVLEDPDADNW